MIAMCEIHVASRGSEFLSRKRWFPHHSDMLGLQAAAFCGEGQNRASLFLTGPTALRTAFGFVPSTQQLAMQLVAKMPIARGQIIIICRRLNKWTFLLCLVSQPLVRDMPLGLYRPSHLLNEAHGGSKCRTVKGTPGFELQQFLE